MTLTNIKLLKSDQVKTEEMKLKVRQHCYRKVRKVLDAGLNGKSTVKAINTWTFAAVRYTAYIMD